METLLNLKVSNSVSQVLRSIYHHLTVTVYFPTREREGEKTCKILDCEGKILHFRSIILLLCAEVGAKLEPFFADAVVGTSS